MMMNTDAIFLFEDVIANAETDERKNAHTLRTLNRDLAEVVSAIQEGAHAISKELLIEAIKREIGQEHGEQEFIADLIDEKITLAFAAQLMWKEEQSYFWHEKRKIPCKTLEWKITSIGMKIRRRNQDDASE